jgi:glycosyltransferase involved in cell wall biosynthesis
MGGAEVLMSTLLPELERQGTHVELICLNSKSEPLIINRLKKAHIKIHTLSFKQSLYNPIHIFAIHKLVHRIKPDIIHAHIFPTFYWVALAKFFFRHKAPLILTEHDTSNRRMANRIFRLADLFIYRNYAQIICISDGVLNVIRNYIPFVPSKTIYNGISLEQYKKKSPTCKSKTLYDFVERILSNSSNKIILSIGRLVAKKNQETMIRMMSLLPSNYHLLICGEGEYRENLEKLIQELNLTNNVFLLGNQDDIPFIAKKSSIGILSSTIEGFGLAAAEMMASGLPVVSSNIPGLNELCPDPQLQSDPMDVDKFASIIQLLLTNNTFYNEMKQKSIEKAESFSIQKMAENYRMEYEILQANK